MIGKSISHYRILEKLGGGGMGVVYKAEDTKLHRIVALKFLPPELTRDEEAKQRFIQEAQSASSLDHINICVVHEIDQTDDGQLFICMNYYEGETLKEKIEKGRLRKEDAIDITIQVVQGLIKAHEKGIVHRDIKPANIFITNDGIVKILDFGLAKLSCQVLMTKVGSTLGTIAYMSPEQARGEEVDQRTDIWSLGVVLYEMITGKLPFKGEYEQAIIYGILNEDPEPITELRSGLIYEIEKINKNCLQKNKDERYQNLDELLKDLNNVGIGSNSNVSIKNKKHISTLWSFVAVLVLSVIIVLGYFLYKNSQPSETNESINNEATDWKNSIAVLPFRDFSSKMDQEFFCNGITDAIIGRLAKIPELKVIATTSVMRYRNTEKDIKEIGRELNVANILEGTIQKEKNRIRLSAQLISTDNGFHLWSETYDREWKLIFEIQDNISQAIAEALKVKLTLKARETSRAGQPQNLEAYEYQLRGMNLVNNYIIYYREEDFISALDMFQKAIEIEPGYAAPYAGLAWTYQHNIEVTGNLNNAPLVIKYSELAFQKNPNSAEANAAIGWVYHIRGDNDKAFQSFKRAIELNPNSLPINHAIGTFYADIGLCYQSIKYTQKAIELDPYYLYSLTIQAGRWRDIGQYVKAENIYKKVLKMVPNNTYYQSVYAYLQIMMGKYSQAEEIIKSAKKFSEADSFHILFCRNILLAVRGEKDKTLLNLTEVNRPLYLAGEVSSEELVYSILGMKDKAINSMKKNIQEGHEYFYYQLLNNPFYNNLRSDSRFQEIIDNAKRVYEERIKKYGNL